MSQQDKDTPKDIFKPFLYVNAGIVGASVALAAAALTALPAIRQQTLFDTTADFFERMAWVIAAAVAIAIVMQALRTNRYRKSAPKTDEVSLLLAVALTLVPAYFGYQAFESARGLADNIEVTATPNLTEPANPVRMPPVRMIAPETLPPVTIQMPEEVRSPCTTEPDNPRHWCPRGRY